MARVKKESKHSRAARRSIPQETTSIQQTARGGVEQDENKSKVNAKLAAIAVRNDNNQQAEKKKKSSSISVKSNTKRRKKIAKDKAQIVLDKLSVKIQQSKRKAQLIKSRSRDE